MDTIDICEVPEYIVLLEEARIVVTKEIERRRFLFRSQIK